MAEKYKSSDSFPTEPKNSDSLDKYPAKTAEKNLQNSRSESANDGLMSSDSHKGNILFSTNIRNDEILEGYDDVDFLDSGEFIGPRDVLIFVSRQDKLSAFGMARKQGQFFHKDAEKLRSEGIPEECWNDEAKILERRFLKEKEMFKRKRNIDVTVQVESKPNMTVGMAINSIISLMEKHSLEDKIKGVLIGYFGNGRDSDGAWCFKHGHITFDFILQLYKEFKRGSVMTVVSDCPSSDHWIKKYHIYLDSHQIKPCGHYAKKAQQFLQVISSSSESDKISCGSTNVMSVRAFCTDAYGRTYIQPDNFEVARNQHLSYCSPAVLTCKARRITYTWIDYMCLLPVDSTWCSLEEGQQIMFLRNQANTKWAYVRIHDHQDMKEVCQGSLDDLDDYNELVKEGSGCSPPVSVCKEMFQKYPLMNMSNLEGPPKADWISQTV